MNYEETLEELHHIPRVPKEENLETMEALMASLSHPEKNLRLIHVTGTNGKGSTCKMLSQVLVGAGYRTGLFTSPYIYDFRERIQVNHELISQEDVVRLYARVVEASRSLEERGYRRPSEFETVTAMSLLYFQEKRVEVAIMEVGIGGRYDATNVIDPILSILTSITFDHMKILGDTLEKIAWHKAGIMKGKPAVSASQHPEVRRVLQEEARVTGTPLVFAKSQQVEYQGGDSFTPRVKYTFDQRGPLEMELGLLGVHQMLNAGVVLLALEELKIQGFMAITDTVVKEALRTVTWPGRMEVVSRDPLVIIDGAHNLDGAVNLRESLDFHFPQRPILLILGMLKDKDVASTAKILARNTKMVLLITPQDIRGMDAAMLKGYLEPSGETLICSSAEHAVKEALNRVEEGDLILCAGSLYTIQELHPRFLSALTAHTPS
ncbi:bifunctional folylpolyglutamate synthase/dihydrofolate synthase [Proteiniclasticum sp. BAD-10]|uniref:tetrahydrofolate synthase n=1 Tax=Proteiniclasticum sediminis TaxID=2804028 RepID=A0A941HP17_9CLOT|nr:folylpolyglutamate synthase/dihydrofolate synthase family protein [Proteiniclasticum sediminis]MBR0574844.1 bifunctional folylpolyglutamate synthase/dihydrofolate synthase [Proteiniclasticum sediminis]